MIFRINKITFEVSSRRILYLYQQLVEQARPNSGLISLAKILLVLKIMLILSKLYSSARRSTAFWRGWA